MILFELIENGQNNKFALNITENKMFVFMSWPQEHLFNFDIVIFLVSKLSFKGPL